MITLVISLIVYEVLPAGFSLTGLIIATVAIILF
jgi:hypothetical protein